MSEMNATSGKGSSYFSFLLPDHFVSAYAGRPVQWGYMDAGGCSLGEVTFLRTYSRLKADGTKEQWHEVCERVVNGMFSLQKDHAQANRLPWDEGHALTSATEAYERMFTFKWLPPGRGLWMMGTEYVMQDRDSASLNNCGFVSTADFDPADPARPYAFLMEASMLGIGIGFNTDMAALGIVVQQPAEPRHPFKVEDSREGWVESVRLLLNAYLAEGNQAPQFDYSAIRPAGTPIRGFGGTAAGPEPLMRLHAKLEEVLSARAGTSVDTELVVDIANLIGVCVVAGNVRRSALIALGQPGDDDFVHLKDPERFPRRNSYDPDSPGWGWMSNNSVYGRVGMDYSTLIDAIAANGEPGIVWMDVIRSHGRTGDEADQRDFRAVGVNPCSEQPLESYELCTLVEVFLNRHDSLEDFMRTLKFAYMYGKTVTLVPTRWSETNAVMQRNRRIGCSISGIAEFADTRGLPQLRQWMDQGYAEVRRWDRIYSEWLCVRESIRTTTVKPSGSVSILAGSTPGVHWAPGGKHFLRAIRFASGDPMVELLAQAGYQVEPDLVSANTMVAYFPVTTGQERAERDVSIFEKIHLAAFAQKHWSDNAVSVTVTFDPQSEAQHIETVLHMHEGTLKTMSFLPSGNTVYPQMPYTAITAEEYDSYQGKLGKVDFASIYLGTVNATDALGEAYCTTDKCELKTVPAAAEFEDEADVRAVTVSA